MSLTRRKKAYIAGSIAAAVLLLTTAVWYRLDGLPRERPKRFVGTWKLESAEGKQRNLRYQFDAAGSMWTSAGSARTKSDWHVSNGELVLVSGDQPRPLSVLVRNLAERLADPSADPQDSIRFAVQGSADRIILTPTKVWGATPTTPQPVTFVRVAE